MVDNYSDFLKKFEKNPVAQAKCRRELESVNYCIDFYEN